MRDRGVQTHRLTVTHGLTHAANRRSPKRLRGDRESVSLIFDPKHFRWENRIDLVINGACPHVCVCARVRAPAHVKGRKTDSPDSQTHACRFRVARPWICNRRSIRRAWGDGL